LDVLQGRSGYPHSKPNLKLSRLTKAGCRSPVNGIPESFKQICKQVREAAQQDEP